MTTPAVTAGRKAEAKAREAYREALAAGERPEHRYCTGQVEPEGAETTEDLLPCSICLAEAGALHELIFAIEATLRAERDAATTTEPTTKDARALLTAEPSEDEVALAVKAVHRALASEWMTVAHALAGNQQHYEGLLDGLARAALRAARGLS